jgi:ribosomal protein L37AE/L43A
VPIADSAGAVTGFGIMIVILLSIVGVVALGVRNGRKVRREYEEVEAVGPHDSGEVAAEAEPNAGAIGLAVVAAVLAVVSVFLPALETNAFSRIAQNTMIQSGGGWLILGCAVGILGAVYRVHSTRMTTWAVFVLGSPLLHGSVTVNGSPAVGIYAAGAAGLLAVFAGFILAGNAVSSYQGAQRRTKVCPDCAETVLGEARVCKHCGHQFDHVASAT